MEREPVQSSLIQSVGHDEDVQILEVELCSGGVYQYMNVSEFFVSAVQGSAVKGSILQPQYPECFSVCSGRLRTRSLIGRESTLAGIRPMTWERPRPHSAHAALIG